MIYVWDTDNEESLLVTQMQVSDSSNFSSYPPKRIASLGARLFVATALKMAFRNRNAVLAGFTH